MRSSIISSTACSLVAVADVSRVAGSGSSPGRCRIPRNVRCARRPSPKPRPRISSRSPRSTSCGVTSLTSSSGGAGSRAHPLVARAARQTTPARNASRIGRHRTQAGLARPTCRRLSRVGSFRRAEAQRIPLMRPCRLSCRRVNWRALAFLGVPAIGLLELALHLVQTSSVVALTDYAGAKSLITQDLKADDLVLFAPYWNDPVGRETLGNDVMTLERSAFPDVTRFPPRLRGVDPRREPAGDRRLESRERAQLGQGHRAASREPLAGARSFRPRHPLRTGGEGHQDRRGATATRKAAAATTPTPAPGAPERRRPAASASAPRSPATRRAATVVASSA